MIPVFYSGSTSRIMLPLPKLKQCCTSTTRCEYYSSNYSSTTLLGEIWSTRVLPEYYSSTLPRQQMSCDNASRPIRTGRRLRSRDLSSPSTVLVAIPLPLGGGIEDGLQSDPRPPTHTLSPCLECCIQLWLLVNPLQPPTAPYSPLQRQRCIVFVFL